MCERIFSHCAFVHILYGVVISLNQVTFNTILLYWIILGTEKSMACKYVPHSINFVLSACRHIQAC